MGLALHEQMHIGDFKCTLCFLVVSLTVEARSYTQELVEKKRKNIYTSVFIL